MSIAFQRGEMELLEQVAAAFQDCAWTLARRGFLTEEDGLPHYVKGISDHDVAERVVVQLIADRLSPGSRQASGNPEGFQRDALLRAQSDLRARAVRGGRLVSLSTDQARDTAARGVDEIERLLAEERPPDFTKEVPHEAADEAWAKHATDVCTRALAGEDARTHTLVRMRFVEGKTEAEVAAHFTCGIAAVKAHEARVRRRLTRALRAAIPDRPSGPATQDALLSGQVFTAIPPPITRARIHRDALRRTFVDEPAAYSRRLPWAVGAGLVAATAWALMFLGVLPNPEDDPVPEPAVQARCTGGCTKGQAVELAVRAPRNASRVGLFVATADKAEPLLLAPTGGPIRLPLGARSHVVPLPYPGTWPVDARADVVAVFSEGPIDAATLADVAAGRHVEPGVTAVRGQPR